MNHVRGSTETNTWTIDKTLLDSVEDGDTLTVNNKNCRQRITIDKKQLQALWDKSSFVTSKGGCVVKLVRFPWHPLY